MTMPLSQQYGLQVDPADKVVIDEWLNNPGESAFKLVRLGYPKITARGARRKLNTITKNPQVERYLIARRQELGVNQNIRLEHSILETAAIAYTNIYDYVEISGDGESARLKPREALNEAQQRCVKEIKIRKTEITQKDGTVTSTTDTSLKLWDKQKANNDLTRLMGWTDIKGKDISPGLQQLIQIGVLVLPPDKTAEEAIASYVPHKEE